MFELKRIGIVKRASALLLDIILLAVLATGMIFVISLICNYDAEEKKANDYYEQWEDFRSKYIADVADYYGFEYEVSEDGNNYTIKKDGEASSLNKVLIALVNDENRDSSPLMSEAYGAYKALPPLNAVNAQYEFVYNLLFMMVSIGILLAYLILELIIPLIFKNGQTIGKKVFSIGVIQQNGIKISNLSLFARTVIGKYAIETMFPTLLIFLFLFGELGLLAIILLAALALLNIILFFTTKNKTPIHDIIVSTVVIDISLQEIYQSEDEMVEKKAKDYIKSPKS